MSGFGSVFCKKSNKEVHQIPKACNLQAKGKMIIEKSTGNIYCKLGEMIPDHPILSLICRKTMEKTIYEI